MVLYPQMTDLLATPFYSKEQSLGNNTKKWARVNEIKLIAENLVDDFLIYVDDTEIYNKLAFYFKFADDQLNMM